MGGAVGSLLGFLGGAVGTYYSIKNTGGPRERAFMIRASAVCWAAVASFLVALWYVPPPYRASLWLPYGLLLPVAICASNREQERIRREEADDAPRGVASGEKP
jgi:hypothetical protein